MNFFCSSTEFDNFMTENEVDMTFVIKCDLERSLIEAKDTFEIR